ncbi:MAG: phenylalanine--tRNA ligase subunit beta, partial [Actinobacteria bacterium]|nr:phenylalanine--tRNA ligase subunit beta [Actinomycetota bacterium]
MKFPISWISEFVKLPSEINVEIITQALVGAGFEVEGVQNLADEINGPIKFGKVISIEEITEYKKPIRWVSVDVGEIRNVICGAQNFKVGDHVVVALPGALLPGPFPITARETYGRTSDGMICSARELGMGDDHTGILVISAQDAPIGSDAIATLGLDEKIFDIAINPDRGYAMSIRGIAREIATALNLDYLDPTSLVEVNDSKELSGPIKVKIKEGADRIHLRSVSGVNPDAPSPLWMVRRLQMCGMRSISIAVDITNYVMIELGQPLHAFDSDRIKGAITVRMAKEIKSIKTLDEQERELFAENLLIADDSGALAIAGTMGGFESEVTSKTKAITIEAAHFDSVMIAKNARSQKLSTEASRR